MTRFLGFAVTLTVIGGGCTSRDTALTTSQRVAVQDSLRTTLDAFQRATSAKQWDSVSHMYADDSTFRWIEDGRVVARSAAAIRQHLLSMPASTSIETAYDSVEYLPIAPGVGALTTRYTTTVKDSAGAGYSFGGILSMTFVHKPGGWRIISGHTSSPRTPASEPAPAATQPTPSRTGT